MRLRLLVMLITLFFWTIMALADSHGGVPILAYHNLDPVKKGSMTISTHKFEMQMQWLKDHGYTVIPLQTAVDYLLGKKVSIPAKSVVITDDDGRKAVYTYLLPIAKKFHIPITLFIYPMIISHANYALTWEQLKQLQNTGLFTIEDHTYWHPNFKQEKKRLSEAAYAKLVHTQLVTSKNIIDKKLGTQVKFLAWPFGIYNKYLEDQAKKAGYVMAFSIDARDARKSDRAMAMPRYMIIEGQTMKTFGLIVEGKMQPKRA